jgi:hypothetical protein
VRCVTARLMMYHWHLPIEYCARSSKKTKIRGSYWNRAVGQYAIFCTMHIQNVC